MSSSIPAVGGSTGTPVARRPRRRISRISFTPGSWLGILPFTVFVVVVFGLPVVFVVWEAFRKTTTYQPKDAQGHPLRNPVTQQFLTEKHTSFTASNLSASLHGIYRDALVNSLELSLITAVVAAILGVVLTQAIVSSGNRLLKELATVVSAVSAQFGGIPLAFIFIATLDANAGTLTVFLQRHFHIGMVSLQGLTGVGLVYLYFLVPLMVLVMMPALEGLKPQWGEAAENLGASRAQYWRYVAGPVLLPTFLGGVMLLFCSAFSAYATAYALNHTLAIVPTEIKAILSGDVLAGEENLGAALAFDMIVFILPLTVIYQVLQRRTARWLG